MIMKVTFFVDIEVAEDECWKNIYCIIQLHHLIIFAILYFLLQYICVTAVYLPIRYVFPTQSSN